MSAESRTEPLVFVSFASGDDEAREELGRELHRQGIKAYDYSIPHEGDQVGLEIVSQLSEKIEQAPFFIALVSSASTNPVKHIVHGEVRHAFRRTSLPEKNRCVCVVLRGRRGDGSSYDPPNYWKLALAALNNYNASFPDFAIKVRGLNKTDPNCHGVVCFRSRGTVADFDFSGTLEDKEAWPAVCHEAELYFEDGTWNSLLAALPPTSSFALGSLARKNAWMGIYSHVQGRAWPHVDNVAPGCFNRVVMTVCNRLGVSYTRPVSPDSRLPFYDQLKKEVAAMPLNQSISVLGQLDYFESRIMVGSWHDALVHIRSLLALLRQNNARSRFAEIIEGVCLLRLGRSKDALSIYEGLMDRPDENICIMRAKALTAEGRHAEALAAARRAVEICDAKHDPAALTHQEWLTLAVGSQNRAGAESFLADDAAWLREVSLANARAPHIFRSAPENLKTEDRLKLRCLEAHWLKLAGRRSEALTKLENLLAEPVVSEVVRLAAGDLEGLPDHLTNRFYARLADAGIYLDSPLEERIGEDGMTRITANGNREEFWLREQDRVYFFKQQQPWHYTIRYLDKGTAMLRYELRLLPRREDDMALWHAALLELEDTLECLQDLHLCRHVIREWAEFGGLHAAWRVFLRSRLWFPDDPYLLNDGAAIAAAAEDGEALEHLASEAGRAARARFARCQPAGTEWTPAELLQAWAESQNLLGRDALSAAVHRFLNDA
ncbi:MAG TPA: hypothetical protein DIT64_03200 [Verrucomicrobiales bacterium]|nr:hypothetical protein [Verrucomicrobiales bacterium]